MYSNAEYPTQRLQTFFATSLLTTRTEVMALLTYEDDFMNIQVTSNEPAADAGRFCTIKTGCAHLATRSGRFHASRTASSSSTSHMI
jgi:hypothetical protein